jgi:hypothetical protein
MYAQQLRRLSRIVVIVILILVLINTGFQAIPLTTSAYQISQADLQRTRAEVITKSVLILAYRPAAEHVQAISDLQVALPRFQQEQTTLASYHNAAIQSYLVQAQPDYLAIVQATQNILAQKNKPVDMTQVAIILSHERGYVQTMSELLVYGLQRIDNRTIQLFMIECGIALVLFSLLIFFWIRIEILLKKFDQREENV